MAHWISSRLKAAETLLQQIDQQAAESLGKNEKPQVDNQPGVESTPSGSAETKPLLKDQLKKKAPENASNQSVLSMNTHNLDNISRSNSMSRNDDAGVSVNPNSKLKLSNELTESDWTELLSVSDKSGGSKGRNASRSSNGAMIVSGLKKDGKKVEKSRQRMNLSGKPGRNETGGNYRDLKSSRNVSVGDLENADGNVSTGVGDVTPRTLSHRSASSGSGDQSDERGTTSTSRSDNNKERDKKGLNDITDGQMKQSIANSSNNDYYLEMLPVSHERKLDSKMESHADVASTKEMSGRNGSLMKVPLLSNQKSDSGSDSTSTSDSETEREREERRKMRQQVLAERAAAKAVEAIKERENLVARLEGEKQSLEKILEQQAKQQVQEASELQTSMMETMEAVELEKQKHNNTRRESLTRLARLESENAELAKSLANVQKRLELEVYHLAEIRQQFDLREATHEELQRKIASVQQRGDKLQAPKGVELAMEMIEAEYSFITDKMGSLQEKAKTLESSIATTRKEMEHPTEVEIELKRRLHLLTDHLIQKQAQVETLTSEKATLLFRIEAVSRLLEENKSLARSTDTPSTWQFSNSKIRPMLKDRMQSGQQHFGSLVRQLDSVFCSGAVFLRRNSSARIWSLVYIACLHLWVIYIMWSHHPPADDTRSGAVVSLENMNYTGSGAGA